MKGAALPLRLRILALLRHRQALREIADNPCESRDWGGFDYREPVRRFWQVAIGTGWVVQFAWPAWQSVAAELVEDPERLARASVGELEKLLTTHSRKERFCAGHVESLLSCGHFETILQRLERILEESAKCRDEHARDFRDGAGRWTRIGMLNPNRQLVLGSRGRPGNDHCQSAYWVRCLPCGADYGANGSDLFQRRCPECQGGRPGLPF